jgi:hypothetical protein
MAVRLTALHVDHALLSRNIICALLVLISVGGSVNPKAMVWLEGLGKFKKFNDLIMTQTCGFLACIILPQPSMLLRAPAYTILYIIKKIGANETERIRKEVVIALILLLWHFLGGMEENHGNFSHS